MGGIMYLRVPGSGFRVQGVQGSGFRVQRFKGSKVQGFSKEQ
jgi:hypothetical protein